MSAQSTSHPTPKIYKAVCGTGGDVIRGVEISETDAVLERQAGRDVVVCGQSMPVNRKLAETIEKAAHGQCIPCPPHIHQGPGAMYHFHPDPRTKAAGHCFYETTTRKSVKSKPPKKKPKP